MEPVDASLAVEALDALGETTPEIESLGRALLSVDTITLAELMSKLQSAGLTVAQCVRVRKQFVRLRGLVPPSSGRTPGKSPFRSPGMEGEPNELAEAALAVCTRFGDRFAEGANLILFPEDVLEACTAARTCVESRDVAVAFCAAIGRAAAHSGSSKLTLGPAVRDTIPLILSSYITAVEVVEPCVRTLCSLLCTDALARTLAEVGGTDLIILAMERHTGNESISRHGIGVLDRLEHAPEAKAFAPPGFSKALPRVLLCMDAHPASSAVQVAGLDYLNNHMSRGSFPSRAEFEASVNDCLRCDANRRVLNAATRFQGDQQVQVKACSVLFSFARTLEGRSALLASRAGDVLRLAKANFPDCAPSATQSLRLINSTPCCSCTIS